jgi:hypothetical protein
MTTPEVVRCPDGHFRRAIYSLGPYIADYPEQVWLAGIVQGWCPKYAFQLSSILHHLELTDFLDARRNQKIWTVILRRPVVEDMKELISSSNALIRALSGKNMGSGVISLYVFLILENVSSQANQALSHLHMDFHALISTPFCRLIFFIKSLKVPLRTTW